MTLSNYLKKAWKKHMFETSKDTIPLVQLFLYYLYIAWQIELSVTMTKNVCLRWHVNYFYTGSVYDQK